MPTRSVSGALGAVGMVALAVLSMGQGRPSKLGDPLPRLSRDERARFLAGLASFQVVDTVATGLGPVFNDNACAACHNTGAIGGGNTRLETRFGRLVNGAFDPMAEFGGSLMQSQGIGLFNGVNFVAEVVPPQATTVAQRRTTSLFGLGLVDNVPEMLLQQVAAMEMAQAPETAGRVNVVLDTASGQARAGRFGWKCQQATLLTFSGDAYLNEMGITTPMFPVENCPQGACNLLLTPGLPAVPNEPDNDDLAAFTDFMTFLAPPPSGSFTSDARQGANLFAQIGCANCHLPTLQTGRNTSATLDRVTFRAVLRLPAARHGGPRGRHRPGRGRPPRDEDGAALGRPAVHDLPPRRPRHQPLRRHPGPRRARRGCPESLRLPQQGPAGPVDRLPELPVDPHPRRARVQARRQRRSIRCRSRRRSPPTQRNSRSPPSGPVRKRHQPSGWVFAKG